MSARSGCGVFGCLIWVILIPVVIVAAIGAVVAVMYRFEPPPRPDRVEDFLSPSAIGYFEANLDSHHAGIQGLVRDFEDSIMQPRLEKAISHSPPWVRPLAGWSSGFLRHEVVPRVIPHAVSDFFYRAGGRSDFRPVLALCSRMPIPLLEALNFSGSFLNLSPQYTGSVISVGGHQYRIRALDHRRFVIRESWILLSDSLSGLSEALANTGQPVAVESMRRLRAGLNDTSDVTLLLDNRNQSLRPVLVKVEPKLLATVPAGQRDVVAFLFERAITLSEQVVGFTIQAQLTTPDWDEGVVSFELQSPESARAFVTFLQLLDRFARPELARSHVKLDDVISVAGEEVRVQFSVAGTRDPIMRFLKQSLR